MRRYLPYLFVLGLLMVSCVRDVEIDLEDLPDRIVLNASVCPGKDFGMVSNQWHNRPTGEIQQQECIDKCSKL